MPQPINNPCSRRRQHFACSCQFSCYIDFLSRYRIATIENIVYVPDLLTKDILYKLFKKLLSQRCTRQKTCGFNGSQLLQQSWVFIITNLKVIIISFEEILHMFLNQNAIQIEKTDNPRSQNIGSMTWNTMVKFRNLYDK